MSRHTRLTSHHITSHHHITTIVTSHIAQVSRLDVMYHGKSGAWLEMFHCSKHQLCSQSPVPTCPWLIDYILSLMEENNKKYSYGRTRILNPILSTTCTILTRGGWRGLRCLECGASSDITEWQCAPTSLTTPELISHPHPPHPPPSPLHCFLVVMFTVCQEITVVVLVLVSLWLGEWRD